MKTSRAGWIPEMSVGVPEIDQQHQTLFEHLDRLHLAMLHGHGREEVQETLEFLAEYVFEHFQAEEKLFDEYGYPEAESHKAKHAALIRRVEEFLSRLALDNSRLSTEVSIFLGDWLQGHILGEDQKYADFLRDLGVAEKRR